MTLNLNLRQQNTQVHKFTCKLIYIKSFIVLLPLLFELQTSTYEEPIGRTIISLIKFPFKRNGLPCFENAKTFPALCTHAVLLTIITQ